LLVRNRYLGLETGVEELPPRGEVVGLVVSFGVSLVGSVLDGSDFLGSDDFGVVLPGEVLDGAV
jgi:hypothetical protein